MVVHTAHFRWLWSQVAKNNWEMRSAEAAAGSSRAKVRWAALRASARLLARRPVLDSMTRADEALSYRLRPTRDLDQLLDDLQPDLVFNGMHVHGPAGDLPMRIAARRGIPTAAFVYSWDNLTSRSRIFVPYDHYFVWNDRMRDDLLRLYPDVDPDRVDVTGTPQFDFHTKDEYLLPTGELADRIGFDPDRPFVLYTTGVDRHFPEEHRFVRAVSEQLQSLDLDPRPQLVVRTYVKGTSDEMHDLVREGLPDTFFPQTAWHERWYTPAYEDLAVYSSLLRHCAMGVNAASTVSLELLALDKPVLNLGFDPPGSDLPYPLRWVRHIEFDHFDPVARSGATMVARSEADIRRALHTGLDNPGLAASTRRDFIDDFMNPAFDGKSGERVADRLLAIADQV